MSVPIRVWSSNEPDTRRTSVDGPVGVGLLAPQGHKYCNPQNDICYSLCSGCHSDYSGCVIMVVLTRYMLFGLILKVLESSITTGDLFNSKFHAASIISLSVIDVDLVKIGKRGSQKKVPCERNAGCRKKYTFVFTQW